MGKVIRDPIGFHHRNNTYFMTKKYPQYLGQHITVKVGK
jgi:hypothetical protein